eukprot:COSAG01_NODE_13456_length_1583_cov_1.685310_3_plen_227_part_00
MKDDEPGSSTSSTSSSTSSGGSCCGYVTRAAAAAAAPAHKSPPATDVTAVPSLHIDGHRCRRSDLTMIGQGLLGAGSYGQVRACSVIAAEGKRRLVACKTIDARDEDIRADAVRELQMMELLREAAAGAAGAASDKDKDKDKDKDGLCCLMHGRGGGMCAGNTVVIFMDLMGGGTLRERLVLCGPCKDLEVARYFAASIVLGLQALHDMGILHRDLKPGRSLLLAR